MGISPARVAAFDILLRIEREQSYASELLHSARFSKLSSADHGLTTELVMGVLRWQSWLDCQIAEVSSKKPERLDLEVLTTLRLGAYQLKFLSRVPAHAAIYESVELVKAARKRSAATFVNAVLRKMAASATSSQGAQPVNATLAEIERSDSLTLARNSAHPEWLVAGWIEHYGLENTRRICVYDQHPPATSLRIDDDQSLGDLAAEGISLAPGYLLTGARIALSGEITLTQAYRSGLVAIQDEGSQLVAMLLGRGNKILDCCAAPGGKTALLAKQNPTTGVIAADIHPHRVRLLRELVRAANVRALAADATNLPFSGFFDRILADVPCSGTGTLSRNPEIKWRLQEGDLKNLQSSQIAILKSALARVSVGGRLLYSTCSMEPEENEDVVTVALGGQSSFGIVDCRGELEQLRRCGELNIPQIETLLAGPYLRTIPGVHQCDGFFAVIIERSA
ncbi:MAG TPA: 16S rRNA (cytosine(967)-C(5))-methyltransferase RsmB [Terriglobales bacterium]|nr:16S rRNA (cytosine(967)-C(5))-methyltransferase RsmB [Terriglobales bacterium]